MIRTGRTLYQRSAPVMAVRPMGRSEPWPVFAPNGQRNISQVIKVGASESIRVSAYNLCDGCIRVDRVVLGTAPPFKLKCCERTLPTKPPETAPPILYRKPAEADCGGQLVLSPDPTEVVLDGPGTYQLSFDGCSCTDGVYIEAQRIPECCERR